MPEHESTQEKITAAAEKRMRRAGFHGFSFRDVAADVGIKSASVHHYFPTKEDLGAAVTRSYTQRFMAALGDPLDVKRSPEELLKIYINLFRRSLLQDKLICLCGVLGSEAEGLPEKVNREARQFFERNIGWLQDVLRRLMPQASSDEHRKQALTIIAALEGAMILAHSLGSDAAFETIAAALIKNATS
ncbi:MAG: TetR/AcrR family transcriptional regulator [Rhodomicrobium sp.]|nr:TetR/AcrR family transcriptional regulator [Rhodomicrobium sp.]